MKQDSKQGKDPKHTARDNGTAPEDNGAAAATPSTDMQPEDTGTPESGNTDRASATENVMKQTSKTPHERGER